VNGEQVGATNGTNQIGTPSAPDGEHDGFGACKLTTSSAVPSS
jgi:hypothetical protein